MDKGRFVLADLRYELIRMQNPPVLFELVEKLESAVIDGSNTAFDFAKSIIETVCKTILNDRGGDDEDLDQLDLQPLLAKTLNYLPVISASHPNALRHRGSLMNIVKSMGEIRNKDGWASHGPDGFMAGMEQAQIEFVARTSETLTCFLLRSHANYPKSGGRVQYYDNDEFNTYVDELFEPYEIFGMTLLPSEVLYFAGGDQTTYYEQMTLFEIDQEEIERFDRGDKIDDLE